MKTLKDYINQDNNELLKYFLFDFFAKNKSFEIEVHGGYYTAVFDFYYSCVQNIEDCFNNKWFGWTIEIDLLDGHGTTEKKLVCPQWAMNCVCENYKHAKALFKKYAKEYKKK